jgi:hypothetical protein
MTQVIIDGLFIEISIKAYFGLNRNQSKTGE